MTNPARELAELLSAWRVDNSTPPLTGRAQVGGVKGSLNSVEFWAPFREAMHLARQYELKIDQLEASGRPVAHYRASLPAIYIALVLPRSDWANSGSQGSASTDLINQLHTAADAIEHMPELATLSATQLQKVIEGLRGVAAEAEELPDGGDFDHLRWKVQQALRFAEHVDEFGEHVTSTFAAEVVAEAVRLSEDVDVSPDRAKRLKAFAYQIFVNLAATGVGQGAVAALGGPVEAGLKALSSTIG